MAKKKSLIEQSIGKTVPAIALALMTHSMGETGRLTDGVIKNLREDIAELEIELSRKSKYINRIKRNFNEVFFETPKYENEMGEFDHIWPVTE